MRQKNASQVSLASLLMHVPLLLATNPFLLLYHVVPQAAITRHQHNTVCTLHSIRTMSQINHFTL
jgi:hypothetical protein